MIDYVSIILIAFGVSIAVAALFGSFKKQTPETPAEPGPHKHTWDKWQSAFGSSYQYRNCKECGWTEYAAIYFTSNET